MLYTYISPILPLTMLCAWVFIIRKISQKFQWHAEHARKAIHIAVGLTAISLPWIVPNPIAAGILFIGTFIAMIAFRVGPGCCKNAGSAIHGVQRQSYGDIYLATAIAFLYYRYNHHIDQYIIPLAIITLSDSAAALAGTRYGQKLFNSADGTKSWEGTTMFFLTAWIITLSLLNICGNIPPKNAVAISILIAYITTQIEAYAWRGIDNLFVPIVCYIILFNYTNASITYTICSTLLIVTIFHVTQYYLQQQNKLTPTHVAYLIAGIVFTIANQYSGLILYASAIGLYAIQRPTTWSYHYIGVLCSIAIFWIFVPAIFHVPAYPFFYISIIAYAVHQLPRPSTGASTIKWYNRNEIIVTIGIIITSSLAITRNTDPQLTSEHILFIAATSILLARLPWHRYIYASAIIAVGIPFGAYLFHLY